MKNPIRGVFLLNEWIELSDTLYESHQIVLKFLNFKWHFFWSFVKCPRNNNEGWIVIEKCDTFDMCADTLTRPLPP